MKFTVSSPTVSYNPFKILQEKFDLKLINPANRRKFKIIVVGTGLAGASAAASLAEMGYNVSTFCNGQPMRVAAS